MCRSSNLTWSEVRPADYWRWASYLVRLAHACSTARVPPITSIQQRTVHLSRAPSAYIPAPHYSSLIDNIISRSNLSVQGRFHARDLARSDEWFSSLRSTLARCQSVQHGTISTYPDQPSQSKFCMTLLHYQWRTAAVSNRTDRLQIYASQREVARSCAVGDTRQIRLNDPTTIFVHVFRPLGSNLAYENEAFVYCITWKKRPLSDWRQNCNIIITLIHKILIWVGITAMSMSDSITWKSRCRTWPILRTHVACGRGSTACDMYFRFCGWRHITALWRMMYTTSITAKLPTKFVQR